MLKKILVFGAGFNFSKNVERLKEDYEIVALTDNDVEKCGKNILGYVCCAPQEALKTEYEQVLIASDNLQVVDEIKNQLKTLGNTKPVFGLRDYNILCFAWKNSEYTKDYEDCFGNKIIFEEGVCFRNISFYMNGRNNKIVLQKNVKVVENLEIYICGDDNSMEIGERTTIVSAHIDLAEGGSVQIGKDCMLSANVDIFQSATHPIFDKENGLRMNPSKNIVIGNHVWIGKRAALMTGFAIGDESVVGYGSVSSGRFGSNVTIAGSPAQVVRENVEWRRDVVGFYELNSIENTRTVRWDVMQ